MIPGIPLTRSRKGARPHIGALAAVTLIAGAAAAAPATDGDSGPLPWRLGGRMGFTVDAAAFPDSVGHVVEVYVRVPPATMATLARGPGDRSRVRLSARLRDAFGGSRRSATEEVELDPSDTTSGFGKVALLRFPTRPGPQHLEVKLEDLHSRKRGLAYVGRRVVESASVEGDLEVPGTQAGRELSDLEFVWSEDSATSSVAFQRAGRTRLPNPERLYGLYATRLRAFFEARGLRDDERPWRWMARILDSSGRVVTEREGAGPPGRGLAAGIAMDVSREPAGGYDLEVKAWQEGDPGALLRRARFSVAWQRESWLQDPDQMADIVHLLLPAAMEDSFPHLQPGEQEAYMNEFWRVRDPDPETPRNEAREEFMNRVAFANRNYSQPGPGGGLLSDMGRIYARYGEPNEILREVVPAGDNTLLEILEELSITEDRPVGEVRQKGPGGDMRPFEVWIYEGDIPLPPDADPAVGRNPRHKRLVFLFVDQQGTGDYRLRYSTE